MLVLLTAFVVTLAVTASILRFGSRLGLIDTPSLRSMHTVPVPRSGGLACMVGMAAGVAVAAMMRREIPWAMLALALALGLIGLADDRWGIKPLIRLFSQLADGVVSGVVVGGGRWILLGGVVVPTAVNVVNFMDGINGITGLSMIVWGATAAIAGSQWHAATFGLIGLLVLGSAAGFLPWNAPRARIFLGDGGSYAFGGLVGVGTMIGAHGGVPIGVLVSPMAIYLADTGTVLIRRFLTHQPLFEPHRTHVYQRLVTRTGWPHITVSCLVAGLSALISAAWLAQILWLGVAVTVVAVALYLVSPLIVPVARLAGPPTSGSSTAGPPTVATTDKERRTP